MTPRRRAEISRVRLCFRNFAAEQVGQGFDFVILGHTHATDEMKFTFGDSAGQYLNLGYPRDVGKIGFWSEGEPLIRAEFWP